MPDLDTPGEVTPGRGPGRPRPGIRARGGQITPVGPRLPDLGPNPGGREGRDRAARHGGKVRVAVFCMPRNGRAGGIIPAPLSSEHHLARASSGPLAAGSNATPSDTHTYTPRYRAGAPPPPHTPPSPAPKPQPEPAPQGFGGSTGSTVADNRRRLPAAPAPRQPRASPQHRCSTGPPRYTPRRARSPAPPHPHGPNATSHRRGREKKTGKTGLGWPRRS